jgi:hypothetical protein
MTTFQWIRLLGCLAVGIICSELGYTVLTLNGFIVVCVASLLWSLLVGIAEAIQEGTKA